MTRKNWGKILSKDLKFPHFKVKMIRKLLGNKIGLKIITKKEQTVILCFDQKDWQRKC